MKNRTWLVLLFMFTAQTRAQLVTDDPARPTIGTAGQIFTIRILPRDRRLEIKLVDAPLATLTPDRLEVTATVKGFQGQPQKVSVEQVAGQLRLTRAPDAGQIFEFKIHDKVTDRSEKLNVEIKSRP